MLGFLRKYKNFKVTIWFSWMKWIFFSNIWKFLLICTLVNAWCCQFSDFSHSTQCIMIFLCFTCIFLDDRYGVSLFICYLPSVCLSFLNRCLLEFCLFLNTVACFLTVLRVFFVYFRIKLLFLYVQRFSSILQLEILYSYQCLSQSRNLSFDHYLFLLSIFNWCIIYLW